MPDLPRVSVAGGSVAPGQLGRTLLHEHLVVTSPEVWASWTALLGSRAALVDRAAAELAEIKAEHGIDTIVDVSTPDMGRDSDFIEEVSARSGVAVVVASRIMAAAPSVLPGARRRAAGPLFRRRNRGRDRGRLHPRAGVIKVASGRHLDDSATKIFRAAALAHQATGMPHHRARQGGPRQHPLLADLLESLGVSPGSVCLAHVHDTNDYGYLANLAERGYWLGLDRFPGAFRGGASPAEQIGQVERLAADGYAAQLCVSHDWCTRTTLMTDADERRYRDAYNPDGFSYCHRRLVPELARRGLAGLEERLFVDNPRRYLAPRTPGRLELLLKHRLQLGEGLQAPRPVLHADAAPLPAAERLGRPDGDAVRVDPHRARLETLGRIVGRLRVRGPHGGAEGVLGRVGAPDRIVQVRALDHRQDRPELLLVDQCMPSAASATIVGWKK